PAPSLRSARIGVSQEMDAVVRRALSRHPSERFASAGEFARAFGTVAGRGDQTSILAAAPPRPLARPGVRLPRWDSTLATLVVILVLLGLVAFFLNFSGAAIAPATTEPARTQAPAALVTPNVVGTRLSSAIDALQRAGFGTVEWDVAQGATGKACDVTRQDPAAGATLQRGQRAKVFYIPGRNCTSRE
ncbi:MAG TPA: PASTA domain-containing protein, partial [Candidatus Limnocylindria bacterium]|nr:PASTA domain-containing protein [Candidatus Limnocylindria bacterium]